MYRVKVHMKLICLFFGHYQKCNIWSSPKIDQPAHHGQIDLNTKSINGMTAFHWACLKGMTTTVEMMMDNAESFKLELTAKTCNGKTGFQLAKETERYDVIKLIERKMTSIAY